MVYIAVLFLPGSCRPIVPKEAREAVGLGSLDHIFHVIEIEPPRPGVGLGPHRAAVLPEVARDILGHIFSVKLAENLFDMILIAPVGLLVRRPGMAPV